MAFKKHGVGEVLSTENADPQQKTAAKGWSERDERDLRDENERADNEEN